MNRGADLEDVLRSGVVGFLVFLREGADDVLVEAAESVGLDGDEVRAFLAGDGERDVVLADHNLAQHIGINGVPCFILDGRYAVSGPQSPDVFKRMIETANLTAAE